jgi:carbon-monoxide dehydrogenase medium subunit
MDGMPAPALTIHRSRKLIPEFRLHRPQTAAEAAAMKAACGADAVYMAGGIDVVNRMKFGAPVTDVIHLGGVAGLDMIEDDDGGLRLGALVTHDRMANSATVRSRLPVLADTWPDVANIRIRCKGTIGGNIMAREPAYDFGLVAMAADARLHFLTGGGDHAIAASDVGATQPNGLLTAITFPSGAALKMRIDRSLRPVVTLALGLDIDDGRIAGARVAIGCAYATPIVAKLPLDEAVTIADLVGQSSEIAEKAAANFPEPLDDHHAGSAYRRRMIEILLRRNLSTFVP